MAYATVVPGGTSGPTGPTGPYQSLNTPKPMQVMGANGQLTTVDRSVMAPPSLTTPAFGSSYDTSAASHVTIDPDILNSMKQYQDAAYQNQTAVLDPQMQQQKAQFDAQMAAQGLQPGSQAYNQAYQQLQQSQAGAYQSAYNNSFQTGLGAQNQAFTQGYDNSQLANALATARIGANATLGASANNLAASEYGADKSYLANQNNNATNQLLGMGNLGLGYGQLQNQQNNSDMQNLLSLYGMTSGANQYNNGLIGGAQNTLFGMIPNMNPASVDVTGAYGLNQAGQNAQYQGQVASANGTNQMLGTVMTAAAIFL